MDEKAILLFQVKTDNSRLEIYKQHIDGNEIYLYHTQEPGETNFMTNKNKWYKYDSFEEAFAQIDNNYFWHNNNVEYVEPAYSKSGQPHQNKLLIFYYL